MRSSKARLLGLAVLLATVASAFASGPRYVTGPPFFPGTQAVPIGWKQTTLLYSTDPGDLSTAVNHATADAIVAAAAGVWNVPVANLTVGKGGTLAEHVSGSNTYLDTTGMVWPADVMSTNAAAVPMAVVYDTDGSVTETLLGAGASLPSGCRTNSVTESVDKFDPAGYIVHAVIVINGRCTGTAAAQQLELQYKLERVFGRVLGLAWSQTNDNVFTGTPTPTRNQALNWPILHPVDIICGLYSYQCLPNPFTLRPDDIASMVLVYPIANGTTPAAGKQVSLQSANGVQGSITFPNGEGMAGVNVLLRRTPPLSQNADGWYEASAVSGALFRRAGTSPFVTAASDALSSMGTVWQGEPGLYTIAYAPLYDGSATDDQIVSTEAVNPLYTGSYSLGAYAVGTVSPAGSTPAAQTNLLVSPGSVTQTAFAMADAPAPCGTGTDGTTGAPASMAATGWWNATLCGYGHASYLTMQVKPARSFMVEATALDGSGLATMTKALPVLGVFAPTDSLSSIPSLGVTPAAFQGLAAATTTLSVQTGQLTQLSVAVADQRGDGRPDYPYQGRVFYADEVEPVQVPAAGGTVTITGLGFRAGNAVLVNGAAATATQWTTNTITAKLPAMTAVGAVAGTAVDVEVIDHGTGATTTMYGALRYSASAALPNAMVLVSAPGGTLPAGSAAATPMAVRLVTGDGVTPVVGEPVVFSAGPGTASFAACGGAKCTVTTDATGLASTGVTPLAAGTVMLTATDGSLTQKVSFTAQTQAASMLVLRTPAGTFPVGTPISTGFVVQVLGSNGAPLTNHLVTFSVPIGSAIFVGCNAPVCTGTTDGGGITGFFVTPTGAGPVTIQAGDGSVTAQRSFSATQDSDILQLVTPPSATTRVGVDAGTFTVRLVGADGVTPVSGQNVTFTASDGVLLSICDSAVCTVKTNSGGLVGLLVVPQRAGTFTVQAAYGTQVLTETLTATVATQTLRLVSAPADGSALGNEAAVPFAVQLLDFDGVTPVAGVDITLSGAVGQVLLSACGGSSCLLSTDGNGTVSTKVTPLTASTISLNALYLPLQIATSFTAAGRGDILRVVSAPAGNVPVGATQTFTLQLLQGDGVTPDAGKSVTFVVTNGAFAWIYCGNTCTTFTDGQGFATETGFASAAGPVTVTASSGNANAAMSFSAQSQGDVLRVVSAPGDGAFVGSVAAPAFAVRVLSNDGVTAVAGRQVALSVSGGSATLGACGAASCTLSTDATGLVSSTVTPAAAGVIGLLAADGTVTQAASFSAVSRADVLKLVSAPANGAWVGTAAATAFAVQVLIADGVTPAAGRSVTASVTNGSAGLAACGGGPTCVLQTDSSGIVQSSVTPLAAGTIGLLVTDGAVTQAASFTAVNRPDVLKLVSAPADGAWVGVPAAGMFAVQVLLGDGVTPAVGKYVTFLVTNGAATLGACGSGTSCMLQADSNGMVASVVTPLGAGTIGLQAADGSVVVNATFTAVNKPDVLAVVSLPANGSWVGEAAASAFAVRVFAGDGVTPVAGRSVVLSVVNGLATLGACGAASCAVSTDATGLALSAVTPGATGTITLMAADGTVTQSASFTSAVRPDAVTLVSVPGDGALVGDVAAANFAVKVAAGGAGSSGQGVSGRSVTLSVTSGSATLTACGATTCTLVTDANGMVQTGVLPRAAGAIGLLAADGSATQAASFTAVNKPDAMTLVSVPGNGAWVGEAAASGFAVRVMKADGVTPEVGLAVTLSGSGGLVLGACGAASCVVVTDATGLASSAVTPALAGTLRLQAVAGSLQASASFTAVTRPDVLTLVSAPADGALVGDVAAAPFAVKVTLGGPGSAGAAVQRRSVTVSVTNGNAVLTACGAASCALLTDGNGLAQSGVLPKGAGVVGLLVADGALSQTASFTAVAKPDVLDVASVPAGTVYVGDVATTSVRALLADGVSPASGRVVRFAVSGVAGTLSGCGSPCTVTTDANGLAAVSFAASVAGLVGLAATEVGTSSNAVSLSWNAVAKPDVLAVASVPAGAVYVGDVATASVRALLADGVSPASGRVVLFALSGVAGTLSGCGSPCTVTTDANGLAAVSFTASVAGVVGLAATEVGTSSNAVGLSWNAAAKPDVLVMASVPAGTVYVGDVATASVRALLAHGVSPASGRVVGFAVSGVAGTLSGCGSPCTVTADANGFAAVGFTASVAGVVGLAATEVGTNSNGVSLSWNAVDKPDTMTLVSAPAGNGLVGDAMPVAFAVKVLKGDGTAAKGRSVVFAVTVGQAGLAPCGALACTVVTDANGVAQVSVTPTAAGQVQVQATEGSNVLTAVFTAAKPDVMVLVSSPGSTVRQGGTAAHALSVRVVLADGVTPVAGLTVTFSTAGRGAGSVVLGACGAGTCNVLTGADGVASTTVTGTVAGAVQLVVTPAAASGAQALTLPFEVVANDDSLNALEAVTYVAEGSALRTMFMVSATANGAAAASLPVTWIGASGLVFASDSNVTDARGQGSMGVTLGPLAGNAASSGTACAWTNVCTTFALRSVALGDLQATVVSGGGQAATGGAGPAPVVVEVTDGGGHGVTAAEVTVYQTVTAWSGPCPAQGRCPAAPVLASKVTVVATDEDGRLQVQPLVVTGSATATQLAFSVGTAGFATAVVTSSP